MKPKSMITRMKKRTSKAYAMGLFVMVLMTVSSLVVVSFMASTQDIAESQLAKDNGATRAIGQDALSRFYAEFTTNEDFRTEVIASQYDNTVQRTLDSVPFANLDKAEESLPGLGEECDYTLEGSKCVKISVALQFFGPTGTDVAEELAEEAAQGNPVVIPQAIAVRADVFGECVDGELTSSDCKLYGSFTQRIIPSQFYQYAFYNQYSVLDPSDSDVYSTPEKQAEALEQCGDRYALRNNDTTLDGIDRAPRDRTNCVEIAYQSDKANIDLGDTIDGPLFSNDDYILTCNSPRFEEAVYVNPTRLENPGAPGQIMVYRSASEYSFLGCEAANKPRFNSPLQPEGKHLIALDTRMPNAANYTQLADALTRAGYVVPIEAGTVPADLVLSASSSGQTYVSVNGSTPSLVLNDFIYVKGDATIRGEAIGSVSAFASGDLEIIGDVLRYELPPSSTTPVKCVIPGPDPLDPSKSLPDNCKTVIGLAAGGAIDVRQLDISTSDANCPALKDILNCGTPNGNVTREIHAILTSLDSTVRVPGWGTYRWENVDAPTLKFYGAMATKYQGVFGGYDQVTGNLISGFRKDFRFDSRLAEGSVNVPFMPSPISGDWTRLDFSEIPVG